jgi:polysaccharide export outer membrane protein
VAAVGERQAIREYLVGPEDLLEISLYDIEDASGEPRRIPARVSQTGVITLPLVGQIEVAGNSAVEIEGLLRERYREFIHEPQITVFVKEYRSYRISVVGHVENPGLFEVSGEKTLLEILGMAGGLNKDAGTMVQLTRQTQKGLRTHYIDLDRLVRGGDLRFNVPLRPGDVVSVPKAGVFYVEGSVKNPGSFPLRGTMTVTQAIATAGGPNERLAKTGQTMLYRRGVNGDREAVRVDVNAIRSGRAEDPLVAENDVIMVPMSNMKYMAELLVGRIGIGFSPLQ